MAFVRAKWAILTFFSSFIVLSLLYRSQSKHSHEGGHVFLPYDHVHDAGGSIPLTESHHQESCLVPTCKCPLGHSKDKEDVMKPWDSLHALKGTPTKRFRDNLRQDKHYMTAWTMAGFTNEFMAIVNMIYLATITDRIPIIPPFAPSHHISKSAGIIPFGDVFNLTHLRAALQVPILEWREVKDLPPSDNSYDSPNIEHLGCWSTRNLDEQEPFNAENMMEHLGLDVSYTRVPEHVRRQEQPKDIHVVFSELSALTYPNHPSNNPTEYPLMYSSPMDFRLSPDQHLACFDFLYYATSSRSAFEWEYPWSPAWRTIGKNLPFTERMMILGKYYLATTLNVAPDDIPPFIAVHARRGDFVRQCFDTPGECLPPLSTYSQKVQEIQEELLRKHGLPVHEVIIASDETDSMFWDQVKALGWTRVNHDVMKTVNILGEWYPALLDVVIQSMAVGFVGTVESTFSLVSRRRVEDWNQGVTQMVRKGGW